LLAKEEVAQDESWPFRFPSIYGVADVIKSEMRRGMAAAVGLLNIFGEELNAQQAERAKD
jgi:hypothetical protein